MPTDLVSSGSPKWYVEPVGHIAVRIVGCAVCRSKQPAKWRNYFQEDIHQMLVCPYTQNFCICNFS